MVLFLDYLCLTIKTVSEGYFYFLILKTLFFCLFLFWVIISQPQGDLVVLGDLSGQSFMI